MCEREGRTQHLRCQHRTLQFVLHEDDSATEGLCYVVVGFHECIFTGRISRVRQEQRLLKVDMTNVTFSPRLCLSLAARDPRRSSRRESFLESIALFEDSNAALRSLRRLQCTYAGQQRVGW